jgi:hypothetical protein
MNTTFVAGVAAGASNRAIKYCATISSARRLRPNPSVAVEQN